jgi:hypothetical protein
LAAALVVAIMVAIYQLPYAAGAKDWMGYEYLYSREGAWLVTQGRDPAFVWLLSISRQVLGANGYEVFRGIIYAAFMASASWLAYVARPQRRLAVLSPIAIALVLTVSFLLKSLIEIREGLAFLFVLVPAGMIFGRSGRGAAAAAVGTGISTAMHIGTVVFLAIWLAAAGFIRVKGPILAGRLFQRWMLILAVAVGVTSGLILIRSTAAVGFLLHDYGVDTSAYVQGGLRKYLYWVATGGLLLLIRAQVLDGVRGTSKFAYGYATALVSGALPAVYAVCLILVFTNFYIPAFTAFFIRLLFTCMELSLVIVVLRGRADWATLGVALAMLADRVRLLLAPGLSA